MKSLKDGLQVYALTFADERAENGILTISRWPFKMKGRRKRRSQPARLKGGRGRDVAPCEGGSWGGYLNPQPAGWAATLGFCCLPPVPRRCVQMLSAQRGVPAN